MKVSLRLGPENYGTLPVALTVDYQIPFLQMKILFPGGNNLVQTKTAVDQKTDNHAVASFKPTTGVRPEIQDPIDLIVGQNVNIRHPGFRKTELNRQINRNILFIKEPFQKRP
ncbi:MAG: hypothetical protein J5958_05485 [Clostridia bacterium]|nr:hypothetical protein [Clostridia bacterium]